MNRIKLINDQRKRLMEILQKEKIENNLEYKSDDEEFDTSDDYDSEDEELIKNGVPDSCDYLVEEILDVRISTKNPEKFDYFVKWEGWKSRYNEWIYEDDIGCFELLYKFVKKHPEQDSIDLIFGGPPCQSFSSRNRYGSKDLSDSKNSLVFSFLKFVEYFKPKYFLIENVVGLLEAIDGISEKIKSIGYHYKIGILSAAHFQTPQKRNRVFIWGGKNDLELPEYPKNYNSAIPLRNTLGKDFYYSIHNPFIFQSGYLPPVTMWDILSDLPTTTNRVQLHEYAKEPENIYQQYYRSSGNDLVTNHNTKNTTEKFQRWISAVPKYDEKPGADWKDIPIKIRSEIGIGYLKYRNGVNMLKRLQYHLPCSTILTSIQPMSDTVIHPMEDRIISIREAARIQGFKDNFEFIGNDQDCYKQIGNAVAVPVAFQLGKSLVEIYFKEEGEENIIYQQTETITPKKPNPIEDLTPIDIDSDTPKEDFNTVDIDSGSETSDDLLQINISPNLISETESISTQPTENNSKQFNELNDKRISILISEIEEESEEY